MSYVENVPSAKWETWTSEHDATILDVREPSELELGILPDALCIPMGEIVARTAEIPAAKPVLVVCRSGARSMQVANYLFAQGYTVANMAGGMKALGMQD